MVWLFLFCLGLTLYFIVQYSVVRVTRTPWWQLWLALMIPAFVIAGWALTHPSTEAMPTPLLVGAFVVSVLSYVILIGRKPRIPPTTASALNSETGESQSVEQSSSPLLSQEEQTQIQNCFPWSVYYLQNIDYRPQAVICRGQLRAESEVAYQTIRQNVQTEFGDRFLVLFQTGAVNQPFFALVANPYAEPQTKPQRQTTLKRPGLALGLVLLTLLTTTLAGLSLIYSDLKLDTLVAHPQMLLSGLPYAITLIAILGIHELGHYFTAIFYKLQTTLPYFIPVPFAFGTFGAYTQIRTPIPSRKIQFDVGIAGPLAGIAITLPILIWGLLHSQLTELPSKPEPLSDDFFNPRFSFIFAGLCRIVFGQWLTSNSAIDLHPVAVAGIIGLLVTALNLIPFGQFDGGQIVHAIYGQRMGLVISHISRILVLLLSFVQPVLLFWGIFLMFVPAVHEPALNDVSELDNYRDTLGLVALGLLLLIILPVPTGLEFLFFTAHPTP
jgi:membrane-associated protease RseP (regulator of RpoE activity)